MNQLVTPMAPHVPALIHAAGGHAQTRFWEFFVKQIRNPHTRRAYARDADEFIAQRERRNRFDRWCQAAIRPANLRFPLFRKMH